MKIQFSYTSPQGDTLDLANNENFILTDVDGLTKANVALSTSSVALIDGDTITNTRTQARQMQIYLLIPANENIEAVKRQIFQVIKPKQTGWLYFSYQGRNLAIQATIEAITLPRFSANSQNGSIMQISVYCASPYWRDAQTIVDEITQVTALHHFELVITESNPIVFGYYNAEIAREIINDSDAAVGVEINVIATGDISNPKIERADGTFFGVNLPMEAGDELKIVTEKGNKSVTLNGENVLADIMPGSTWFQLEVGSNYFVITESGGSSDMFFTINYKRAFV
jgi:hypothetical protein